MASSFFSTALLLSLLLSAASAQSNPGSYDISAEQGWDKFVKEAAKGTGGTPINMNEFVTRVNGNIKDGGEDEEADPELMEELKSFDEGKGLTPVEKKSSNTMAVESRPSPEASAAAADAAMDDLATAKMIASVNGGSLAPENAPFNGALSVKVVGVVSGLLTAFAAFFVL